MDNEQRIRVGITHGDTNGVGYEVIMKTFAEPTIYELCTPIVYGNPKVMAFHRKAMEQTVNYSTINDASEARPDRLNLVAVQDEEVKVDFGKPAPEAGQAALEALERALADYRDGKIDVLVTAPINKSTIQSESFHFPGHTEYIQDRVGEGSEALMILMNDRIRVALVTTHMPISRVAGAITEDGIVGKLRTFNQSLKRDFNINMPRIAVLALNPHAGDNGLLGHEENTIIKPAMETATQEGIRCFGPFAADGFFGARTYEHYDGVLAMYHDQGLTAFKTIAMDDGVNFTAGLPIVRTSPDHGTAYDIAGQGRADENSFRQAIFTAIDVWRNRGFYDEALVQPLEKLYHERREDDRRGPFMPRRDKPQPSAERTPSSGNTDGQKPTNVDSPASVDQPANE